MYKRQLKRRKNGIYEKYAEFEGIYREIVKISTDAAEGAGAEVQIAELFIPYGEQLQGTKSEIDESLDRMSEEDVDGLIAEVDRGIAVLPEGIEQLQSMVSLSLIHILSAQSRGFERCDPSFG